MYLSIVLIPLITSIFAGIFGRKLGAQGSQFITTCLMFLGKHLKGLYYQIPGTP